MNTNVFGEEENGQNFDFLRVTNIPIEQGELTTAGTGTEPVEFKIKKKIHKPSYKTELAKMRVSRNKWRFYAILAFSLLLTIFLINALWTPAN
jgi:hypothetical protein